MSTANLESGQTTLAEAAKPILASVAQWSWWRAALKGEFGELKLGLPESGYYRWLQRDGSYKPVAIWQGDDGAHLAKVGDRLVTPDAEWCERVFAYCCKQPITYATYESVMKGEPWPDAAPVKPLSNMPADPHEAMRVDLDAEAELVDQLLRQPIADDATAGRAASLADRIAETGKRADALRADEKKPHDDAAKAVQQKWKPLVDRADSLKRRLKDAIGVHLIAKKRKAEEEERARRAAAEEARRQAEAEAVAKGEPAPPPPPLVEPARPVATKIAGAEGRTIALRTEKRARIVDYGKAQIAFAGHQEMKDLVQTLANRAVKAGVSVDGVEVEEIQKAA